MKIPIEKPRPDFDTFERVLKGELAPRKVHFVELGVDEEIMRAVTEDLFGARWVPQSLDTGRGSVPIGARALAYWVPQSPETRRDYIRQRIEFFHRLGYDSYPAGPTFRNMPESKARTTADTAELSHGQRSWVDESGGLVKTWDDFERIAWDRIEPDVSEIEVAGRLVPDGMKVVVWASLFEMCLEYFFGYEDLFILSVENPELVAKVFEMWGRKVYDAYRAALDVPNVGALFHADDLGYGTSTMLSPEFLRAHVFPWFARYAALAHERDGTYWYHCCGNVSAVMGDLIDDVRIDAFHSFQDSIIPIGEFSDRYGERIAALGGIDMDKLVRLPEPELRAYVRATLDACMPGRFALGSGNSVANYIPLSNYLAMLDEGAKYSGP